MAINKSFFFIQITKWMICKGKISEVFGRMLLEPRTMKGNFEKQFSRKMSFFGVKLAILHDKEPFLWFICQINGQVQWSRDFQFPANDFFCLGNVLEKWRSFQIGSSRQTAL
ncbi:MAG: hypothetical protein NWR72_01910 [Bacteroidia bacterium]|nr:hypothetical protein [Bacteroidia bacterium]